MSRGAWLVALASCGGGAQSVPVENHVENQAPARPMSDASVDGNGDVRFGETTLPQYPTDGDITALFGAPSRVDEGSNDILVYDELGLAIFRTPGEHTIVQLSFWYQPNLEYPYVPASMYAGTLSVVDVAVHAALPRAEAPGEPSFEEGGSVVRLGWHDVYFTYTEGALETVSIDYPLP